MRDFIKNFLNILIYLTIITKAKIAEKVSDIGIAIHTPVMPKNSGNMPNSGTRKSNWRESERKMLIFALPMLWKKLVTTI